MKRRREKATDQLMKRRYSAALSAAAVAVAAVGAAEPKRRTPAEAEAVPVAGHSACHDEVAVVEAVAGDKVEWLATSSLDYHLFRPDCSPALAAVEEGRAAKRAATMVVVVVPLAGGQTAACPAAQLLLLPLLRWSLPSRQSYCSNCADYYCSSWRATSPKRARRKRK